MQKGILLLTIDVKTKITCKIIGSFIEEVLIRCSVPSLPYKLTANNGATLFCYQFKPYGHRMLRFEFRFTQLLALNVPVLTPSILNLPPIIFALTTSHSYSFPYSILIAPLFHLHSFCLRTISILSPSLLPSFSSLLHCEFHYFHQHPLNLPILHTFLLVSLLSHPFSPHILPNPQTYTPPFFS